LFGEFENATSFYINSAGVVFVTDDVTDEVYQLDTLGNELNSTGGFGWEINAFDDPVDVFADPLKVFVTDKNNHRIQRFDKYLNFNFQFYNRDSEIEEERFGYPLSAVQSNLGDVFILDSENKRILKFDLFGNFIQTIGGYDYGNYTLTDPVQLAVSMRNNIYVLDGNKIYIFDNYGTALGNIVAGEEIRSIRIIFQWLTLNSGKNIYISNLNSKERDLVEVVLTGLDDEFEIVSSLVFNSKLFVLTPKRIIIFSP
jgi:DNA-binding beta-propeller fold protein YncE